MKLSFYTWCINNKKENLLKEWDYNQNNFDPNDVSYGSGKKVFWICEKNHSWVQSIYKRRIRKACPYCSGERVSSSYNLKSIYPNIAKEWDYDKNYPLKPEDVFPSSGKAYWWKCKKGHSYKNKISDKIRKKHCSYCKKNLPSKEYNLAVLYPHVLKFWDYDKNDILPEEITHSSKKLIWWRCKKGHSWQEVPDTLRKKVNCPYCSGERISSGYNLKSIYPNIAKEWDYDKNYPLKPEDVFPSSGKEYWWECKNNHKFKAKVNSRVAAKGCPYCNHKSRKTPRDYNLKCMFPDISKEWNYDKNEFHPEHYYPKSAKKVWWKCKLNPNHEWQASIVNRTRKFTGCPFCKKELKTSFPEQTLFYYIKKIYPDCKNRYIIFGKEADVYIPSINLAIEYDGIYRHSDSKKIIFDMEKEKVFKQNNVHFLRVRESDNLKNTVMIKDNLILCKFNYDYTYLNNVVTEVLKYIKNKFDKTIDILEINIKNDFIKINEEYISLIKKNSIGSKFPELAKEWDYTKNGNITPFMINYGSAKKFWWKCKHGHEWISSVLHRSRGRRCPYCYGSKISYENSLEYVNPILSKLWHPTKNGLLSPKDVFFNSHKKVWFKCNNGHEWQSYINIINKYNNCPYCNNRVITDKNNFGVLNKELLKEWNWEKNSVSPFEISKSTSMRVWWKCKLDHEWQARVSNRSVLKRNCPYCSGKKATTDNNLLALYPNIAKEWNYTKNKDLKPSYVKPSSNKRVWWICDKKHEWQSIIGNRVKGYGNCPYCSNLKANKDNNLSIQRAELIAQWNYEKNISITPYNITSRYSKDIWWKCKHGHEWKRNLRKIKEQNICPICKKGNKQK